MRPYKGRDSFRPTILTAMYDPTVIRGRSYKYLQHI